MRSVLLRCLVACLSVAQCSANRAVSDDSRVAGVESPVQSLVIDRDGSSDSGSSQNSGRRKRRRNTTVSILRNFERVRRASFGNGTNRTIRRNFARVRRASFGNGTENGTWRNWRERIMIPAIEVPILSPEEHEALVATPGHRLVLTDLDDTMHCSHAKIFHGMDTNCDHGGEIYPGVAQFQLELSLGPTAATGMPPSVVPLSARPKQMRRWLQITDTQPEFKHYQDIGASNGVPGWGLDIELAQYGSLLSGKSVAQRSFETWLPKLKYEGWREVGPSRSPSIFCGDNGQGDVRAAQMMMAHKHNTSNSKPLIGAFIHHVQPLSIESPTMNTSLLSGSDGTRATLARQGIYLHRNYGNAACLAYKRKFISKEGYDRVMKSILKECHIGRGQATSRASRISKLCQVTRPEFVFRRAGDGSSWSEAIWDHDLAKFGWFEAREADNCDEAEAETDGLDARGIFSSGGFWSIGFCRDVDASLLRLLKATQQRLAKDLWDTNLNSYVYWAMQAGLHCWSDCGSSCSDVASIKFELLPGSHWFVRDIGARDWSGLCQIRKSSVCRLHARLAN